MYAVKPTSAPKVTRYTYPAHDAGVSRVYPITKISVDPAIVPAGFGLSIEQPAWEPKSQRFYVSIPVIADCDNGYGNAINAAVAARRFAGAGISGICIEDNVFPKRCSFYADTRRELVSGKEHALKVRACKESTNGELFIIARTEALIAGFSIDDALERDRIQLFQIAQIEDAALRCHVEQDGNVAEVQVRIDQQRPGGMHPQ